MKAKFKGRTNADAIYIKEIVFKLTDGSVINLKRNITTYTIEDGSFEMAWKGCHIDGARGHDYTIATKIFSKAEIVEIVPNENAPKKYTIQIDSWSVSES